MEKDWVKIFNSTDEVKVQLMRTLLEANEINSVILNKRDSLFPFGQVELHVSLEDEDTALALINNQDENENPAD
jgi:hypothetical protein